MCNQLFYFGVSTELGNKLIEIMNSRPVEWDGVRAVLQNNSNYSVRKVGIFQPTSHHLTRYLNIYHSQCWVRWLSDLQTKTSPQMRRTATLLKKQHGFNPYFWVFLMLKKKWILRAYEKQYFDELFIKYSFNTYLQHNVRCSS